MFNFQRLLCTVIKFHVVKEAKEAVLYVVQDSRYNLQFIDSQYIDLLLLIDQSTFFKDVIQYYNC